MSDPTGSAHRDRERFLKRVSTHLELLQKARTELEEDPVEAAAALRRFSRFIGDEAARLQLADTEKAARGLAEEDSADLAVHADALEAALRQLLPEEEAPAQILIVENEPTSALLAQRAVEGDGRTIYVVGTAKEVRAALEGHEIDLVVLDLILPDADGRHLLIESSHEIDPARTSVVVLTAKGTPTTRAEYFAYGASAFLEKPLDPGALGTVVADLLNRGRSGGHQASPIAELPDHVQVRDVFLRVQVKRQETDALLVLALVETDPGGRGWNEEGARSS